MSNAATSSPNAPPDASCPDCLGRGFLTSIDEVFRTHFTDCACKVDVVPEPCPECDDSYEVRVQDERDPAGSYLVDCECLRSSSTPKWCGRAVAK